MGGGGGSFAQVASQVMSVLGMNGSQSDSNGPGDVGPRPSTSHRFREKLSRSSTISKGKLQQTSQQSSVHRSSSNIEEHIVRGKPGSNSTGRGQGSSTQPVVTYSSVARATAPPRPPQPPTISKASIAPLTARRSVSTTAPPLEHHAHSDNAEISNETGAGPDDRVGPHYEASLECCAGSSSSTVQRRKHSEPGSIATQVEALRKDRDQLRHDFERLTAKNVENKANMKKMDDELSDMEQEIKNLNRKLNKARDETDTQRQKRQKAEARTEACEAHFKNLIDEKEKEFLRKFSRAEKHINFLEPELDNERSHVVILTQRCQELESQVAARDKTIKELNSDLTKVGNSRPVCIRDDAYFDSALGRIFENCNQWALQLCMTYNPSPAQLQTFSSALISYSAEIAGPNKNWIDCFLWDSARMVECVLVRFIARVIMDPSLFQGLLDEQFMVYVIGNELHAQDDESHRTRSMLFSRLLTQPKFQEDLAVHLDRMATFVFNDLRHCASPPLKPTSDEKRVKQLERRRKKLCELFMDAATVFLEMLQEPAIFGFFCVVSGELFDDSKMKAQDQQQSVHLIVDLAATPIVTKMKFGAQESTIFRKSKVYLKPVLGDHVSVNDMDVVMGNEVPNSYHNVDVHDSDGVLINLDEKEETDGKHVMVNVDEVRGTDYKTERLQDLLS